jgi:hypothetical protein
VTPPCGHVHHALFSGVGPGVGRLNAVSAQLAESETCIVCVPAGGSTANLRPTMSWNKSKKGWKIEDMP